MCREFEYVGEEIIEAPLELPPRIDEVMRRELEVRSAREAMRKVRERGADAADIPVRQQPLLIAHVRIDEAKASRKLLRVRIERGVNARDLGLERLVAG